MSIENDVLTKTGRPIVTEKYHEIAHFGSENELIRKRLYWPDLYKYIQMFTSPYTCCQLTKADNRPTKAPLLPMDEPEYPLQFIAMDIQYMPEDENGFKYVLPIGNLFTKYVEAVPLRDQSAKSIVTALNERWVFHHGSPSYILSDQKRLTWTERQSGRDINLLV